ncbi:hypothetical protein EDB84DRAFT_1442810 [Lactarius hengduanensis]|nr:hypothetical protein EDB84DRAFT_1442810 [Lactarius hengduanensis]
MADGGDGVREGEGIGTVGGEEKEISSRATRKKAARDSTCESGQTPDWAMKCIMVFFAYITSSQLSVRKQSDCAGLGGVKRREVSRRPRGARAVVCGPAAVAGASESKLSNGVHYINRGKWETECSESAAAKHASARQSAQVRRNAAKCAVLRKRTQSAGEHEKAQARAAWRWARGCRESAVVSLRGPTAASGRMAKVSSTYAKARVSWLMDLGIGGGVPAASDGEVIEFDVLQVADLVQSVLGWAWLDPVGDALALDKGADLGLFFSASLRCSL